ncbi:MAG: YdcF family protein [Planctomycetota bacterium]|nr:YdcF family protein [Planctomycetota bacterium]
MLRIAARAWALFIGLFAAANAAADLAFARSFGSSWWVDLFGAPYLLQCLILLPAGLLLVSYGLRPEARAWRRTALAAVAALLLAATAWNAACVWRLAADGRIALGFPVPFSSFAALGFGAILADLARGVLASASLQKEAPENLAGAPAAWRAAWRATFGACAAALALAVLFPLAQMCCLGRTDYRRSADVAVVLGARAYEDGSPSQALYDRVRTGVELYREGCVRTLLFSGGPGDGAYHETDVMRALARKMGVPDAAILCDRQGVNTQATAEATAAIFDERGFSRVLVVSHAYHLPRVKLSYQRAGWEVRTVPARESRRLAGMPYFMAREVAALWVYWLGVR